MNQRVKQLRKELKLNQSDFGKRLGVTPAAISKIEKGENSPSEQTIKSICREFNVNYAWLKEGIGDIYSNLPETLLDQVAEEYDLDELDKKIVKGYMQLSKENRRAFKKYLHDIFINEKDD